MTPRVAPKTNPGHVFGGLVVLTALAAFGVLVAGLVLGSSVVKGALVVLGFVPFAWVLSLAISRVKR